MPQQQRGVALLTALLIVALVTTIAVAMAARQQLDIRRSGNLLGADQSFLYTLAVEDWAGQILMRDQQNNQVDALTEEWAQLLPPMPVEGGQVSGYLEDLQGRFNINNLLADRIATEDGAQVIPPGHGGAGQAPPNLWRQRFEQLLLVLQIDPEIANYVVDWLDPDVDALFPGAEDGQYSAKPVPYRAGNGPMASASELLLVEGVTPEIYALLRPYVTALPLQANGPQYVATEININTAPLPVLMSLGPDISESQAEAMVEGRGDRGYPDAAAFLAIAGLPQQNGAGSGLAVRTSYFLLHASTQGGRVVLNSESLLFRGGVGPAAPGGNGGVVTLARAFGAL